MDTRLAPILRRDFEVSIEIDEPMVDVIKIAFERKTTTDGVWESDKEGID